MIKFLNVTKTFKSTTAINDINLNISENKIYCLLGGNGAGKTTFLKLIAGHLNTSEGEITVDNQKASTFNMPSCVNFIESRVSQFNLKVRALINLANSLQDDFDLEFANSMIKKFKLDENKKYKQLSFGMQTMLTTLLNLANNSKVVILDEPTLGFDAIMRERFYELVQTSFEYYPRIIIVSTHLIDGISRFAEDIIIMKQGSILLHASINDIDAKAYSLTGKTNDVKNTTKGLNVIGEKTIAGFTSAYIFGDRIVTKDAIKLQSLGLEELFINIVEGDQDEI
ncbi:ATP-binding cassette domain-containing protein [Paenibacillus sp. sgz500958]|uniref:ATP-binding cassette domain-containing protein n=1 Tax=Paenibacillus sp. sgz500958 TaxID=3242475 RepID=UPI0036D2CCD8